MKRAQLRKTSRDVAPFEFERVQTLADEIGEKWNREPPQSVRLDTNLFHIINRTLDPQEIECAYRNWFENLCDFQDAQTVITAPPAHKRHVSGFVIYTDKLWEQALAVLSKCPARLDAQPALALPAKEANQSAQHVLLELEAIRNEHDEPDFQHSSTDHAYKLAKQIIEGAYTHYLGSAPEPAAAPDGDGGLVIDWQSARRLVSLVVPADEDESAYVYSKSGDDPSEMDDPATDEALARRLRSVFAD